MSFEELLLQMEEYRNRREKRDHRPQWLSDFVASAAHLFEPLTDIGRVGFDCQADEQGWLVSMYLGTTEILGGPKDGQIEHASFRIDLNQISQLFEQVTRFEWFSVANTTDDTFNDSTRSVISIHGMIDSDNHVRLELLHAPPKYVAPGLVRKSRIIGGSGSASVN